METANRKARAETASAELNAEKERLELLRELLHIPASAEMAADALRQAAEKLDLLGIGKQPMLRPPTEDEDTPESDTEDDADGKGTDGGGPGGEGHGGDDDPSSSNPSDDGDAEELEPEIDDEEIVDAYAPGHQPVEV
ncbi:MAG TPA: hypothetical protein VK680_05330 [Solirubrobacteraceae bacterium]|jgi:hypothetical protein|nr:hypothetical protein [Solirubrobacteraceae bacterium]